MRKHPILRFPDAGVAEPSSPTAGTQAQPAAPPTPLPSPTDAASSPAPSGEGFSIEDLGKFDEAFGTKTPEPTPEPKPDAVPDAKSKPATDTKSKPAESGPKQLREKLAKVESDLEARDKALADYQKRIADAESKGQNTTALAARAEELQKMVDAKEGELRVLKFTASPEFAKTYDQPFKDAVATAAQEIGTMQVGQYVKDEATDQTVFQPTQAKPWDDTFARIYAIDDRISAIRAIKEKFSTEDAPFVIEHYTALKRLERAKQSAEQSERSNWKQSVEKEAGQRAQQQENFKSAALAHRKELETKLPELYSADPADPETGKRLQQGFAMLDYKPKTFEEAVQLDTRLKMNAAAFPVMAYRYQKMKQERDAALAKLEERNGSGPGVGKKTSSAPATSRKSTDKEDFGEWAEGLRQAVPQ